MAFTFLTKIKSSSKSKVDLTGLTGAGTVTALVSGSGLIWRVGIVGRVGMLERGGVVGRADMVGTVANGIVGKVGRVSSGWTLTWMSGDQVGVLQNHP